MGQRKKLLWQRSDSAGADAQCPRQRQTAAQNRVLSRQEQLQLAAVRADARVEEAAAAEKARPAPQLNPPSLQSRTRHDLARGPQECQRCCAGCPKAAFRTAGGRVLGRGRGRPTPAAAWCTGAGWLAVQRRWTPGRARPAVARAAVRATASTGCLRERTSFPSECRPRSLPARPPELRRQARHRRHRDRVSRCPQRLPLHVCPRAARKHNGQQ